MQLHNDAAPARQADPLEGQPLEHAEKTRVLVLLQVGLQPVAPAGNTLEAKLRRRHTELDEAQLHAAPLLLRPLGKASGPISTQAVLAPAGERMFGWQPQAAGSVPPPH